jgi:hypothetical protein
MSLADPVPLNARSLTFKWNGRVCTLEYDSDYLTFQSASNPEYRIDKRHLWHLAPELLTDRSVPESSRHRGRESRYLTIGAVVAYFSDIHTHVPLLAPALLALGLLSLYRAVRGCMPLQKTKIITDYGEEFAIIPHLARMNAQRGAFEAGLIDAIRRAKSKHYES